MTSSTSLNETNSKPTVNMNSHNKETDNKKHRDEEGLNTQISLIGAFILTFITFYFFGLKLALLLLIPYELLIRHKRSVYIFFKTLPRDVTALIRFVKFNSTLWRYEKKSFTVSKVFKQFVQKHPNKPAYLFEDRQMTFQEVDSLSNQVAHYFKSLGYQHSDTVALFMETRPEYVCIWLGLSKLGVVTALINTNLRLDPLIHSISVANCKAIIYGSELKAAVNEVRDKLADLKYYEYRAESSKVDSEAGGDQTDELLNNKLLIQSTEEPTEDLKNCKPRDKLIYVYTSGTTGLPKAAVITNMRFLLMVGGVEFMLALKSDDIIYDPLPLYHSAGGILGVGLAIIAGHTVALRKKFSASNFWKDCIKYNCTFLVEQLLILMKQFGPVVLNYGPNQEDLFSFKNNELQTCAQYIGEICRYLLTVPEKPEDRQHNLRMMFGNGLRPQIWTTFVKRFQIKQIGEFYGSTEGNSNLVNIDSKVGAVGFVPHYARAIYPVALIKCDEVTGDIIRGDDGFCIRCKTGEPGVFIGKINPKKVLNSFTGYANRKESEKKVIRDVFKKGDLYFNSGDILVSDEFGYYYFRDRTGDTFRWRGENVATSEVEAVISNVIGLNDAVVYGVSIPHVEGKAGMVAIVDVDDRVDLSVLLRGVKEQLPAYARPLFVRVLREVPLTGTFKLKKRDLQLDGFDITKIKDKLYFLYNDEYIPLTETVYNDILSGKIRI